MYTIHKYPIKVADEVTVGMPPDSEILSVQYQSLALTIWAAVHTDRRPLVTRRIRIFGTGHEVPYGPLEENLRYIATVQQPDAPLVWHLFEVLQDGK